MAQRAGSGLIADLAQGLKDVSGVSKDTVRRILSRADDLLKELVGGKDSPPRLLQTYFAALDEFTQAYIAQDDLNSARRAAERAKEVAQKLIQQDLGNAESQRDLSVSHERIGGVLDAQGNRSGALRAYQAALEIHQWLALLWQFIEFLWKINDLSFGSNRLIHGFPCDQGAICQSSASAERAG